MTAPSMVRLRDLGEWSGGNTPSKANPNYWTDGTVPWVSPKDMKVDEIASSEDRVCEIALTDGRVSLVPEGSVLLVTRSGILAHTLPVAVTKLPVTINQDLKALTPKTGVLPKYVAHAMRSASRRILDECSKHGTTVASIETNKLLDFEIPMVNFSEQRRIVAEIEKQFSRLDEAVANLKRVKANLKRYKAAVLKAAVQGRLVPMDARAKASWTRCTLGEVGHVSGGLTKNPRRAGLSNQLPYLRVANVYADKLRLDEIERIGVADSELQKLLLRAGDLLIVEGNGSKDQIGRLAIWDGSIDPCVHQNHLIRVRLTERALPKWVLVWLLSPRGRRHIEEVSSSTSGLYTLSISKVAALPIALPPLESQHRIVAEVERHLSLNEDLLADSDRAVRRASMLRQAILNCVFLENPH